MYTVYINVDSQPGFSIVKVQLQMCTLPFSKVHLTRYSTLCNTFGGICTQSSSDTLWHCYNLLNTIVHYCSECRLWPLDDFVNIMRKRGWVYTGWMGGREKWVKMKARGVMIYKGF